MIKQTILIVDDDVDICLLLKRFFERNGFDVKTAFKGKEGLDILRNEAIDLILTDFRLPDHDGFQMIEAIKKINPSLPIIVITGYSDVNQAVKVIRLGAYEYVTKPIFPEEILLLIKDALAENQVAISTEKETESKASDQPNNFPPSSNNQQDKESFLVPTGAYRQEIQKMIALIAPTNMTALILGESGTGKEVVARMIHENSERKNQAFVPVDCGALTQELAASELFGHVKGAFTGATSDKKGSFELADNGTLFLDEIGNLSYENQVKLLRVLQERKIRRVGDEKDMPVNVRIIVATNEDLKVEMQKGSFREDVFYRINEFKIQLQALRENKEELKEFVNYFLEVSNTELGKNCKAFSDEVWKIFERYPWPGNIRELKNVIKFAVLMAEKSVITKHDLPKELLQPSTYLLKNKDSQSVDQMGSNSLLLKDVVANAEKNAIIKALDKSHDNKTKAAEILGVDRKTLYNKLNSYGLL